MTLKLMYLKSNERRLLRFTIHFIRNHRCYYMMKCPGCPAQNPIRLAKCTVHAKKSCGPTQAHFAVCAYMNAPPSAMATPMISDAPKTFPSEIHPRIKTTMVFATDTTLKVRADVRPMMKNCERLTRAATKPDAMKLITGTRSRVSTRSS